MTYREEMRKLRRQVLRRRLLESGGNIRQAASRAGMHRSHFYRAMRSCGMPTPAPHRGNDAWQSLQ